MTSESQERMLAIVEPANLDAVLDARARAGRSARRSSGASPTPRASACTTGCSTRSACPARTRRRRSATTPPAVVVRPRRRSPTCRSRASATARCTTGPLARPAEHDALQADDPAPRARARKFPRGHRPRPASCSRCSRTPTIADKSWVSRQYDHQLFLNTVVGPGRRRRGAAREGHAEGARARRPTARRASAALDPRTGGRLVGARGGAQRRVRRRARRSRS